MNRFAYNGINAPGVSFVSVASAKTDGVGSHVNFDVPGCEFGDWADPPPVGNIPQRLRLAGRWFNDSQSKLRFNVAHAIVIHVFTFFFFWTCTYFCTATIRSTKWSSFFKLKAHQLNDKWFLFDDGTHTRTHMYVFFFSFPLLLQILYAYALRRSIRWTILERRNKMWTKEIKKQKQKWMYLSGV